MMELAKSRAKAARDVLTRAMANVPAVVLASRKNTSAKRLFSNASLGIFAVAVAAVLTCAAPTAAAGPAPAGEGALAVPGAFGVPAAWADEPADGSNAVDVTQLPDSSFIYDTSITDLSTADTYYDKQTVQVTGEVVGDRIDAGDGHHCWITLASAIDASTVSVYMTNESAAKIDMYGAYGRKGTTLQVRGTFQLACPSHDGVSDLHAQVVSVTEKGKATPDEFKFEAFIPGIITIMIGLVMMAVFYLLRERQR